MSAPSIDLAKLKHHLRLEPDFNDDDTLIESYAAVSIEAAEKHIGRKLYPAGAVPEDDPTGLEFSAGIECGCMLFVGHLYANREAANSDQVKAVPFTIKSLWDVYHQPEAY